jgi:solute carrier family 44 protein 1 (choline transporter-like protein)
VIGVFALIYGNPFRLINGVDSFGNICGMRNEVEENQIFSGMDMSEKP